MVSISSAARENQSGGHVHVYVTGCCLPENKKFRASVGGALSEEALTTEVAAKDRKYRNCKQHAAQFEDARTKDCQHDTPNFFIYASL